MVIGNRYIFAIINKTDFVSLSYTGYSIEWIELDYGN